MVCMCRCESLGKLWPCQAPRCALESDGASWLRPRVSELVDPDMWWVVNWEETAVVELAGVDDLPWPMACWDTLPAEEFFWACLPCWGLPLPLIKVVRSGVLAVPVVRKMERRLGCWAASSALISAKR